MGNADYGLLLPALLLNGNGLTWEQIMSSLENAPSDRNYHHDPYLQTCVIRGGREGFGELFEMRTNPLPQDQLWASGTEFLNQRASHIARAKFPEIYQDRPLPPSFVKGLFDDAHYDFCLSRGFMYNGKHHYNPLPQMKWKRKGEKYFLDKKYMFAHIGVWYSSLIFTSEVLKTGWRGSHLFPNMIPTEVGAAFIDREDYPELADWVKEEFFVDNPQSKVRYERACWDTQTSLFAEHKEMSVVELLRMRIF